MNEFHCRPRRHSFFFISPRRTRTPCVVCSGLVGERKERRRPLFSLGTGKVVWLRRGSTSTTAITTTSSTSTTTFRLLMPVSPDAVESNPIQSNRISSPFQSMLRIPNYVVVFHAAFASGAATPLRDWHRFSCQSDRIRSSVINGASYLQAAAPVGSVMANEFHKPKRKKPVWARRREAAETAVPFILHNTLYLHAGCWIYRLMSFSGVAPTKGLGPKS